MEAMKRLQLREERLTCTCLCYWEIVSGDKCLSPSVTVYIASLSWSWDSLPCPLSWPRQGRSLGHDGVRRWRLTGDCRDAKCLDCLSLYPFLHRHVYWWFTITQKCDFSDKPEVHTQQCSNNVANTNRDHTSSWWSFYLHYLHLVYLYIHTHLSIYI